MSRDQTDQADAMSCRATADDRFVVVCDARSGSGYLCTCLDRHPELACHHELLNSEFDGSNYGIEPFHRSPETDPLAYLVDVRARTRVCSGARLVGFKLHFRQHPEVLEQVLDDPGYQVILLCRRDKLAQWASYQIAKATRQWAHPENDADIHPLNRVAFKLRRYTVFLVHQRAWEDLVPRRRPDCLRVCYEDILRPGELAPLLRAMGVDPQVVLSPASRRQFTGDSTYERFSNPRWAAVGSRFAHSLAWFIALLGAGSLMCRWTSY